MLVLFTPQGVHSPRLYMGISIRENEKKPQKYPTILLITQKYHHIYWREPRNITELSKDKVIY